MKKENISVTPNGENKWVNNSAVPTNQQQQKVEKKCAKCGWDWDEQGLVNCKSCQRLICDRDSCIDDEGICLDCHENNCIEKRDESKIKPKPTIKIKGTLTSQIRKREETSPYYYAFVKLKGHGADLPVVFKVKNWDEPNNFVEPKLKKGERVELTGHYSNSDKNIRKSFTCSEYQLLDEIDKRIKKKCQGCGNNFTCSQSKNYDYCWKCERNSSRYLNKDSPSSEKREEENIFAK